MIWVADHNGVLTYICKEWHSLTGQRPSASLGSGWLDVVHSDDRNLISHSFAEACRHQVEFMLRYRVRRDDGSYIWVLGAATPSFTPLTHDFIGYLGLVSCYNDDTAHLTAKAEVGSFKPGRAMAKFGPVSKLDIVADYLIMAKAASVDCAPELTQAIDSALFTAGRALVAKMQNNNPQGSSH